MNKKIGKLAFPIFFVFWGLMPAKGQKHEIGLGLGVVNYSGDISRIPNVLMSRPGIMGYYRYNAGPAVSLRAGVLFGGLAGREANKKNDPVAQARQGEFEATINQWSAAFEYNFFDYKYSGKKGERKATPYFTAGLSFFNFEHSRVRNVEPINSRYAFQLAIPFGLGFKYRIKSRLNFNAEFLANKTFTDYLDGVSSHPVPTGTGNTKSLSNPLTSDWFYYLGVSLSYTFYKIYCPD